MYVIVYQTSIDKNYVKLDKNQMTDVNGRNAKRVEQIGKKFASDVEERLDRND